jgi:hypothetical protein
MAFYNTKNPTNYVTQNPAIVAGQKTEFLLNGFLQSGKIQSIVTVNNNNNVTYTAQQVINGYTVREGSSIPGNDITPTAAEIIAALNANQSIRSTNQYSAIANTFTGIPVPREITVYPGFYFDWHIYNETDGTLNIEGGLGVSIGTTPTITINQDKFGVLRVFVTNVTPGAEEVYMI